MTTTLAQSGLLVGDGGLQRPEDPLAFWRGFVNATLIAITLWALIFYVGCGCTTNPPTQDNYPWHGEGPNPPQPQYWDRDQSPGVRALLGLEDRG